MMVHSLNYLIFVLYSTLEISITKSTVPKGAHIFFTNKDFERIKIIFCD